ncbi:MAG: hypothetical protein P8Y78_10675, partial [Acidihalobacter sp.]
RVALLFAVIALVMAVTMAASSYYSGASTILRMSGAKLIEHADDPELYNVVERTVVLSTTPLIPASQVERALNEAPAELPSLVETREHAEREYISRILMLTEGNVTAAARLAKRNRTEFYKLLNRHHIDPALFKRRR